MPPSNEDGTAHIGAYIPTNHAEALFQLSNHRSTRSDRVTQSDLIRRYVKEGLLRDIQDGDVPGELADLLDADLLANAGGDEGEVEA